MCESIAFRHLLAGAMALLLGLAAMPSLAAGQASQRHILELDRPTLHQHLRALGYAKHGTIERAKTDSSDSKYRSLPHFSAAFTAGGVRYPYTMIGTPPATGQVSRIKSVIIPLRMRFVGFGDAGDVNVDFDPMPAVRNILASPIYQDAPFANGVGQFGEMMQRATFWSQMDRDKEWRVRLRQPRLLAPIDIEVTPETGSLYSSAGGYFGDVLIDFMDAEIKTVIALTGLAPDELPIFVTDNVTAEALGYHSAYATPKADASETLQTFIWTSWLDPTMVDPIIADVSTINHELGEWLNDPYINNLTPGWAFPPASDPRAGCSGSNYLEVGDPEGNGPTYDDFPTYVVTLNGVDYHLQDLVMLQWFAGQSPSTAYNGWYDFPATNLITAPAVVCP